MLMMSVQANTVVARGHILEAFARKTIFKKDHMILYTHTHIYTHIYIYIIKLKFVSLIPTVRIFWNLWR